MNDTAPPVQTPKKKRGWCFCAGCILIPLFTVICLAGAVFFGPDVADWLGIFGMQAEEVYEGAPDPAASRSLTEAFDELGIPGVKVYVIPIKGETTQGAFIILDTSTGYKGMNPTNSADDTFLLVMQDITRRNRDENLRLAHVTVDYRDEVGETATAFTAPQTLVEDYADGRITQEEFFGEMEIDLLGTLEYLGIDNLLEEIQQ